MSQETSIVRENIALIEQFNEAFNNQNIEATMAVMTANCVFENTSPAPDGTRHEGQAAVRAAFKEFFESSPGATFETEEIFAAQDHCVVRWTYRWGGSSSDAGHVRGVDVFHIQDDKIAAKLAYVKG